MTDKTWWMVYNPYPDGGKPTVRHDSQPEAVIEAKRVCLKIKKKVHVLKVIGTVYPPTSKPEFIYRTTGGEQ